MHPHQGVRLLGKIPEDENAVHRHVGNDAGEAAHRTPLAERSGELVHRLELGMAHDREPVGVEIAPTDVQGERNRPEEIEGPAPGGNRSIEVEAPPAPVDAGELALGDKPAGDGGIDIGEHRQAATIPGAGGRSSVKTAPGPFIQPG